MIPADSWAVDIEGDLLSLDVVDSTNDVARRMVKEGRIRGRTLLTANEQTAGRGTRGRRWISPRGGGLYVTVVDFLEFQDPAVMPWCTRAAGIAVIEALREVLGLEARLKPVNDVVVAGGKLGGILVEAVAHRGMHWATLTGIGINTIAMRRDVSDALLPPMTLEEALRGAKINDAVSSGLCKVIASRVWQWNALVAAGAIRQIDVVWTALLWEKAGAIETVTGE